MPTLTDEVEYGARGTLGLLVPQANTTAEPEVQALLDPDIALLTGRLTSPQPEMKERFEEILKPYSIAFQPAPQQTKLILPKLNKVK